MINIYFRRIFYKVVILITLVFVTISSFSLNDDSSPWKKMAIDDLSTAKMIIAKNSPQSQIKDSLYANWLENGYQKALAMTANINSFPGYINVMRFYLNGFRDFHTSVVPLLDIINPTAKWPGFIVGERDGQIKVIDNNSQSGSWKELPPLSAALISCDGLDISQLIKRNVLPFYQIRENYPSTWAEYVSRLFVWEENPFTQQLKKCLFKVNDLTKSYELNWQVINNASPISPGKTDFRQKLTKAAFGSIPLFSISKFGDGGIWISIPIFAQGLSTQGTTTDQWLTNIANEMPNLRNAKLLVFDLRGNTGGVPQLSYPIIMNLYGADYLKNLGSHFIWNQSNKILFIANQSNLHHMIESKSPVAMIEGMKKAIAEGQKDFVYQDNAFSKKINSATSPVKAKVVVLTDGRCASQCDSFVQVLKSIPGVIQIGQPTAPVASSTWNTVYVFKDNAAAIVYPTGLIISPKVTEAPLFPDFYYKGYMGDTNKLKNWIWQLYNHHQ